jgi:hypothetical protein
MTESVELQERDRVVSWLLAQNPAVKYWTLRDLLSRPENDPEVRTAQESITSWSPVSELLKEQHPDGYWGEPEDVYWPKWKASVWSLILLAEMGVPKEHPAVQRACEHFLKMMDGQDRSWPPPDYSEKDTRGQWPAWQSVWEPCVTGNMARTLTVFGFAEDRRVREMFQWLVRYPLPDGGWNCEPGPWGKEVFHSSFMSTVEPLWAFSALPVQKWPKGAKEVVERASEFMLVHRLYKSDKTGHVINEDWTTLHFPLFYFYDILHGLRVLTALDYRGDERVRDAVELLRSKRLHDGTWPMEATFLHHPKRNWVKDSQTGQWGVLKGDSVVDVPGIYSSLGPLGGSNAWVTLNAMRVLKG